MERALEPEQHAGGPARHLRHDALALRRELDRRARACGGSRSDPAVACAIAKVIARPLSRQNCRIHANSSFEPTPSDTISNTPWPASPMARPIASSSSGRERVPGTRPCTERCRIVREVVKPTAPARERLRA